MTHQYKNRPVDKQPAMTGKSENDTNKLGNTKPTQKNEGKRTPESRHDREDHIGNNQSKMRSGSPQNNHRGAGGRR
jgi:hypothetical protein